jgi:hypothetical protein
LIEKNHRFEQSKLTEGVPSKWPWYDKCDYLWVIFKKCAAIQGVFNLGSKVPFTANVLNLDDYEGIKFIINLNFGAMKSPE